MAHTLAGMADPLLGHGDAARPDVLGDRYSVAHQFAQRSAVLLAIDDGHRRHHKRRGNPTYQPAPSPPAFHWVHATGAALFLRMRIRRQRAVPAAGLEHRHPAGFRSAAGLDRGYAQLASMDGGRDRSFQHRVLCACQRAACVVRLRSIITFIANTTRSINADSSTTTAVQFSKKIA